MSPLLTVAVFSRTRIFRPHHDDAEAHGGCTCLASQSVEMSKDDVEKLPVSPNATHAQIKTAYYKQSFIYHPDKNAGSEEAALRFSEISEAYKVLGNKGLRRKYDRGMLTKADVQGAGRPSAKEAASSTASEPKRSRQSPAMGVGEKSMFDFDEFYRAHYSEQLQRDKEIRWRREQMRKKQQDGKQDSTVGRMTEITLALLMAMTVGILVSLKS
ncbi:hypothetical protein AAFF_G00370780 [Aldrovandia affinis]|uniref:J domain-containing protein n=1 Tax=Aldrovandia affinis TaxID=143900 RepID=A0AAD7SH17_9TELE|nr:hypothetical protein AAFF_G00370780 [Aldrovandia affinis]